MSTVRISGTAVNLYIREYALNSFRRYTLRTLQLRKTVSRGVNEFFQHPLQLSHALITGVYVKTLLELFSVSEAFAYTPAQATVKVQHYSDMSNWTIADFRNLPSTAEKELALQATFPEILENTLAYVDAVPPLSEHKTVASGVQECEVCLTSNAHEFHVHLPESEETIHLGSKCFECCRNREVSDLVRFMDKGMGFWLFDRHSDYISLINAASSAYSSMLAKKHTVALHGVRPLPQTSATSVSPVSRQEHLEMSLSDDDSYYYESLAAFATA